MAGIGWYFIRIAPFLPSFVASYLSLDVCYLFSVGPSVNLSMIVQQLVAILEVEMEAHPSTLPS